MNDEIRKSFGSVPIYQCPSRRGGGAHTTPFDGPVSADDYGVNAGTNRSVIYGPRGCYVFVLSHLNTTGASGTGNCGYWAYPSSVANVVPHNIGPFRMAAYGSGTNPETWMPRDTMAWWADGTSNQILVGEKHLPPKVFEVCEATDATIDPYYLMHDCSYLTSGWCRHSTAITVRNSYTLNDWNMASGVTSMAFPTNESDATLIALSPGKFGSAHPGIVNFLIGDGAVCSFPLTTPGAVLGALATVCDGNSAALP